MDPNELQIPDDHPYPQLLDASGEVIEANRTQGRATNDQNKQLAKLRATVVSQHKRFVSSIGNAIITAVAAGMALMEVKRLLKHGNWLDWVVVNCKVSARTAQRYMRLAKWSAIYIESQRREKATLVSFSDEQILLAALPDGDLAPFNVPRLANKRQDRPKPSSHWRTPKPIVDLVDSFLGEILCDPCAAPGVRNIPARSHYTREDNGLRSESLWGGSAFVNPGVEAAADFVDAVLARHKDRSLQEAILLLPHVVDATYLRLLREFPQVHLDKFERVETAKGRTIALRHGLILVYVGEPSRFAEFCKHFAPLGAAFLPYQHAASLGAIISQES